MSTRINARIDDELARQLDALRRLSGMTLTELIEAALTAYCRDAEPARRSAWDVMQSSGLIGVARGSKNLSRDYKRDLSRSLERKHGHR